MTYLAKRRNGIPRATHGREVFVFFFCVCVFPVALILFNNVGESFFKQDIDGTRLWALIHTGLSHDQFQHKQVILRKLAYTIQCIQASVFRSTKINA